MENNMLVKKIFTVGLLAAGLAACSAANNQINSSAGGTDTSTRTSCNTADCVRIEFVDDPVINLNYSCASVFNVTDETGVARCPAGSTLQFYLQSTKTLRRVVLGSVLVQPPDSLRKDVVLLRVTPLDLVAKRDDVTRLNSPEAVAAINLTRFLQALRERNVAGVEVEPFIATAPVNRIRITDELKDQLDVLTEDVQAREFSSEQFLTKLEPFLTVTGRTLITSEQAQVRLLNTLKAIRTGVYFGSPTLSLPSSIGVDSALDSLAGSLNLGIEGVAAADTQSERDGLLRSTLAIYTLIDRDGASVGQGMQWTGRPRTSEELYSLYLNNGFDKLRQENTLGGFDPITDKVNGQWQWRSVSTPVKMIDFSEGRLLRNLSMVGGRGSYERITTDKNEPPAGTIGRWIQPSFTSSDGANQPEIKGTATINRTVSVNSFFDRTVWRTKDTVDVGERFVFPLHATLKFRYGNTQNGCPQNGCTDLPDLSVTILENGNIISDFSAVDNPLGAAGNCSPVDSVTLKDAEGVQEYRVGVVRAAYTGVDVNDAFIGPTMLFSGEVFGVHDGLQIGTRVGTLLAAPRVKMNIAGAIAATTLPTINITDSEAVGSELEGADPAIWGNAYNAYASSRVTTGLSSEEINRLGELGKRRQGIVTATVTPCYNAIDRMKQ